MRLFSLILLFCAAAHSLLGQYSNTYYTVKFPDDRTYIGCGFNVPVEQPVITNNGCNMNIGISRFDQVFTSNDNGTCYKILRRWRLLDWCHHNPNVQTTYIPNPENTDVGATATGTAANYGYLEYVQIIKVRDDVPPVFYNCPNTTQLFCDYTNNDPNQYSYRCEGPVTLTADVTDACSGNDILLSYRLYLDLDGNGSMETTVLSSSPTAWPIVTSINANGRVQASVQFPTGHGFPYGTHKIEWIANDHCGNEAVCKYSFEVRDCKKPTVVCHNGLSINIMQTGMISIWDTDFLEYTYDNCTPADQLKVAIRKAGTGSGFPAGNHGVTFDCTELGTQYVEIWSQDTYGNADYCLTYINVQDNMGSCPNAASIQGNVVTAETGAPLPGTSVVFKNASNAVKATTETDENGQFAVSTTLKAGCGYQIVPSLDLSPALGITTQDALRIAAHAAGTLPLPNAYRMLAADVNGDAQITAADAQSVVQMAIGAITEFPGVDAWKFWNATTPPTAANALTPNAGNTPWCFSATTPTSATLLAVKSGDVDASADVSQMLTAAADDRAGRGPRGAIFRAQEVFFNTGDFLLVPVQTPALSGLAGFQFTLDYDPTVLSLQGVEPGLVPGSQMHLFLAEHQATFGWQNPSALVTDGGGMFSAQQAFTLIFSTLQSGKLSEHLQLNSAKATAETYNSQLQVLDTRLEFDPVQLPRAAAQLFPPQPNPVVAGGVVYLRYWLPEASNNTEIVLTDAQGTVQQRNVVTGEKGYHEVALNTAGLNTQGVLLAQLRSDSGVVTQRLAVVE